LGIEAVSVYSDADAGALNVTMADIAFRLPGVYPNETYLDGLKIVEIARRADCDAIHPGYGFLAESSEFSKLCRDNSIKFIGPKPETLEISGNKLGCKKLVESRGVPVIPYISEQVDDSESAVKFAAELGFPVLLKSAFGGGGRGIREAKGTDEVKQAFESSQREAKASFGRFAIYIEKKLVNPRHIEVQIIASDDSSQVLHLGERECSIQRRFQKLVELSPSPVVDEETRKKITSYGILAARAVGYSNAGTVEMLRDGQTGQFYFMEMNSRLQVEHPVTELVTGLDLVSTQILVAQGENVPFRQRDIRIRGCAIECRINAENPLLDFLPVTGSVNYLQLPAGPGVRIDAALQLGSEVTPYYDSLLAKLISWGKTFDEARKRQIESLNEFAIGGLETTIPFHLEVMRDEDFISGQFDTGFIDSRDIKRRLAEKTTSAGEDYFFLAAFLLARSRFVPRNESSNSSRDNIRPPWMNQTNSGRFIDAL